MRTQLTSEQCYSICSFLHSASAKFEELANLYPDSGLNEQFKRQAKQATEFATLFGNADNATVVVED